MESKMAPARPNLLVLFSDTHTATASGCYGSSEVRTPHLDRLASEGVLFERAYSQNPLCVPSRQSLLTGLRSFETGVLHNDQPMPPLYTLAHHLSAVGYETAALGKMHFVPDTTASGGQERHFGFSQRLDYEEFWRYLRDERRYPAVPDVSDDPWQIVHLERWQHVLQAYGVTLPGEGAPSHRHILPAGAMGTLPHEDHQEALVLRTWSQFLAREHANPFLAFVSFQSPHPPFVPPAEFVAQYAGPITLPPAPTSEDLAHPVWSRAIRLADDDAREAYLRHYYAFVSYTDWCVGEALRLLEQAGHAEDTVVVYVSDHGDMGYEHGLTGKCVFYEPSVRVPLLMRCPGQIAPGWRHDGLVELVDLFPTLCEAACVDTPAGLAGRSLWPEVRAKQSIGKDAVFSESYPMERNRALFGPRPHRMVLTDRWKLVEYGDIAVDLFDVVHDRENTANLAGDPRFASVKAELLAELHRVLGAMPR
jgi:choline-sulfatase